MTKEYIGLLDSGVGGLSVLSQLKKVMPNKNYIYFGDTKNIPYGTKSKEEIYKYTKEILNFFITQNVKDVVIACNTTSAVAYDELKRDFMGKLNIFPLIQSIAKNAIENLKDDETIAILATLATIKSKKYDEEIHKINPNINVIGIECSGFTEIVENRLYNDKNALDLIKTKIDMVKSSNAKRVILGCTHYPFLENIFKEMLDIDYFNPAICLSEIVKKEINTTKTEDCSDLKFYCSKNPQEFILSAKTFFNVKEAQLINF